MFVLWKVIFESFVMMLNFRDNLRKIIFFFKIKLVMDKNWRSKDK